MWCSLRISLIAAVSAPPVAASSLSAAAFAACATSSASTAARTANTASFDALRASAPARSSAASVYILTALSCACFPAAERSASLWLRSASERPVLLLQQSSLRLSTWLLLRASPTQLTLGHGLASAGYRSQHAVLVRHRRGVRSGAAGVGGGSVHGCGG